MRVSELHGPGRITNPVWGLPLPAEMNKTKEITQAPVAALRAADRNRRFFNPAEHFR